MTCAVERVLSRIYIDQDAKIQEFMDVFQKLRGDLNTGMLNQTVFVTSKVLNNTDLIGMCSMLYMASNSTLILFSLLAHPTKKCKTVVKTFGTINEQDI